MKNPRSGAKDLSESGLIIRIVTDLEDFCRTFLNLDESIRFVGIASLDLVIKHYLFKPGKEPLLDSEETDRSLFDGTIRVELRRILEHRLGDCNFIYASHAKVGKITIPVRESPGSFPAGIMELTLELESDHKKIIEDKIMPALEKHRRELVSRLQIQEHITQ